ncbi:MAG: hypothetical protein AAGD13_19085 [Pseudomonadota bacterium]
MTFVDMIQSETAYNLGVDFVRILHLAAMAVALGSIAATHTSTLKSLSNPLDRAKIGQLEMIHHMVKAALAVLWLSGIGLIGIRTGFQLENFSPKLWTKVAVVAMLTITAFAIQVRVLPLLNASIGRSIRDLELGTKLRLAFFVGLSAAGWGSAMMLGAVRIFKPMPWTDLIAIFGGLHFTAVVGLMLAAWVLHRIRFAPARPNLAAA